MKYVRSAYFLLTHVRNAYTLRIMDRRRISFDELKTLQEDLHKLKPLVNGLNLYIDKLPPFLMSTEVGAFLDDVKYLCGYVDCMVEAKLHSTRQVSK